jgi:hypothetical protein
LGILGEGLLEAVKKKGQEAVRPPLCRSLAHLYVSVPAWADNPGLHGAEGSPYTCSLPECWVLRKPWRVALPACIPNIFQAPLDVFREGVEKRMSPHRRSGAGPWWCAVTWLGRLLKEVHSTEPCRRSCYPSTGIHMCSGQGNCSFWQVQ